MREYSAKDRALLIDELCQELRAKPDGSGRNLICACPYCGKPGKFGIYIGNETERKVLFSSHCFSCGVSNRSLAPLLEQVGRTDLIFTGTADPEIGLETRLFMPDEEEVIEDSLVPCDLPDGFKRCFSNRYLRQRGFTEDDYEYFPAGTTRGLNGRFDDYVIFPIRDTGRTVGYVGRHTWAKRDIDVYNRRAKRRGEYPILRYRNSTTNEFARLLYNYDTVIAGETDTVILVEGVFDVVALTRKMDLYDDSQSAVVATFGKKISNVQIYKLQVKGVRRVIIGFDGDAVEQIKVTAKRLSGYFDVRIADIEDGEKDFDDLEAVEVKRIFERRLLSPRGYVLNKVQV